MEIAELWELMWRESLVEHWAGTGSYVPVHAGRRVALADRAGRWRQGRVTKVTWGRTITLDLDPSVSWSVTEGISTVTISLVGTDDANGPATAKTRITLTEVGQSVAAHRGEVERYWTAVLTRLDILIRKVLKRRDNPRQAIVVIHGIGEQEPGRTLRALTDSGVIGSPDSSIFVKPDRMSDSFELRRVTFTPNPGRILPMTDVYELYWAHLVRDTTAAQVAGWLRRLLLRIHVPRALRPAFVVVWLLVLTVVVWALGALIDIWDLPPWLAVGGAAALIAAALWKIVGHGLVVNILGDAARYLQPRPANIAHRQEIRQAGVDLLTRLHDSGELDRIVVLGHSLGSVVAYDILTQAWIQMHAAHAQPAKPGFKPLRAVEKAISEPIGPAQDLQHSAWQQLRRNTQPWLVTDLVTVGSPLTYADFLMSDNNTAFTAAQTDRILPTCPPRTSLEQSSGYQRCSYESSYIGSNGLVTTITFTTLDHSALFAVTRWTNLFFKVRAGGLVGDIIGGPLIPLFGGWVRDVELRSPVRRFAHTLYWTRVGDELEQKHLDELRKALSPESGRELLRLAKEIPAYAVAERVTRCSTP